MWKPASQLQCWAWFTWAQRGLRLNAGSFITLHSGGAVPDRKYHGAEHVLNMCISIFPSSFSEIHFVVLTCLGLVLAVRATPALKTGALVMVNTFHTGTSILAGITCTFAYICGDRIIINNNYQIKQCLITIAVVCNRFWSKQCLFIYAKWTLTNTHLKVCCC